MTGNTSRTLGPVSKTTR